MGGDLPVKTDSCSAPVSLRKDDVYAPKLEVFGDGFCLGAGDDRLTVGKVCDARNGAFAELCRITQDILFPCVAQNGTLDRGNGEIVAVYDAVVVNGVAAYEGVVHIYIIKEVIASNGYILNEDEIEVSLDSEVKYIEIFNICQYCNK